MPIQIRINSNRRILIPKSICELVGFEPDTWAFLDVIPDEGAVKIYKKGGNRK
jgi:hypothetical protein